MNLDTDVVVPDLPAQDELSDGEIVDDNDDQPDDSKATNDSVHPKHPMEHTIQKKRWQPGQPYEIFDLRNHLLSKTQDSNSIKRDNGEGNRRFQTTRKGHKFYTERKMNRWNSTKTEAYNKKSDKRDMYYKNDPTRQKYKGDNVNEKDKHTNSDERRSRQPTEPKAKKKDNTDPSEKSENEVRLTS